MKEDRNLKRGQLDHQLEILFQVVDFAFLMELNAEWVEEVNLTILRKTIKKLISNFTMMRLNKLTQDNLGKALKIKNSPQKVKVNQRGKVGDT